MGLIQDPGQAEPHPPTLLNVINSVSVESYDTAPR